METCEYFDRCGGCSLQDKSYPQQIELKQHRLAMAFKDAGVSAPAVWLPPLQAEPWHYRTRARLSVRVRKGAEEVLLGFRQRERRSQITDMDHCPILAEALSKLIRPLREGIAQLSVFADIPQIDFVATEKHRAIIVRHMIPLTETDRSCLQSLSKQCDVHIFLQEGGPETVCALEAGNTLSLHYDLPEFDLRLSFPINQFVQINPEINRLMVQQAMALLEPQEDETIADLYCGIGNFSLAAARRGARVEGLEMSSDSIACAEDNAHANGLSDRASFRQDDLDRASQAKGRELAAYQKLLLDPPRSGAEAVVVSLPADGPRRIVYVSCAPQTLARDAKILVEQKGYALAKVGLIDMFPHTDHIEAIAVFTHASN